MKPYYSDGACTIYHGDCREVVPFLPKEAYSGGGVEMLGSPDLLLTDPPYGLGDAWKRTYHGPSGVTKLWGSVPEWDKTAEQWIADMLIGMKIPTVFWGANNYIVPPSACWFIWDKIQYSNRAEFEMAWTTLKSGHKAFRMSSIDANWNCRETAKQHPNEKPLSLMIWCMNRFPDAALILDPFMGSGTTLRAAKDLGRKAIGIEIEERYCEIAANRLSQEVLAL